MVNEAFVINSIIINLGILIRRIVKTAIYVIYIMIFHGSLTTAKLPKGNSWNARSHVFHVNSVTIATLGLFVK
jgi:hypothetical protein